MGKYDSEISRAKVALADLNVNAYNASDSDSNLRVKERMSSVVAALPEIEAKNRAGLMNKLKDAMFETADDKTFAETLKNFVNDVAQLEICKGCRCVNCGMIDETCRCSGCVFGAYVTACDKKDETRAVTRGTVSYHGRAVARLEFDRASQKNTAVVVNRDDTEERIVL